MNCSHLMRIMAAFVVAICVMPSGAGLNARAEEGNGDGMSAETQNGPADDRLAVPTENLVAQATNLIRDAYETAYKTAKESGEPEPLLVQLEKLARDETDPVREYALLVEAEAVAVQYESYKRAVELLTSRADRFRVDELSLRLQLLKGLAGPKVAADLELYDGTMESTKTR